MHRKPLENIIAPIGYNDAVELISDEMSRVDKGFKEYLDSKVFFIRKVGDHIINSGGKRFRPKVLLLASRLCNYTGERHIPFAAVMEFIHTATLLHDDVVDNADLRRGAKTVNAIYGNQASILVGDYLLAKCLELSVADGDLRILKVLADTTMHMAEGEVLQLIKKSDPDTTEAEHLEVVTDKTARLFQAACKIAAIIGGASEEEVAALAAFGLNLGIAYQLTDDSLDYVSSDEDLGKAVGNDLREGKVTLPLIKAYSESTDDERELISTVVEAESLNEGDLPEIFNIIKKYKGIEYAMDRAEFYVEEARRELHIFEPTDERAALMAMAEYVIERNS